MPRKLKTHSQRQRDKRAERREYDERRMLDPALRRAKQIRSSARWRRVRAKQMSRQPLCADPFGQHERDGITIAGEQVHHVKPLRTHADLAFDLSNLMTVCIGCHAKLDSGREPLR